MIESYFPQRFKQDAKAAYSIVPIGIRYGSTFRHASDFLAQSQYWSKEQHEIYQFKTLKSLITHAFNNTTFYHDLYTSNHIHPNDINSLSDIRQLPYVTKADLQDHGNELKAINFASRSFQYHTTGGSTGHPVGLYWDSERTVPLERSFLQRQWRWVGYEMEFDRAVILRGIPVTGGKLSEHLPGKQLRLSTYDMTPSNLNLYIKAIEEFDPIAIQAYPSAAYILARHVMEKSKHNFKSLRVVLCGSENLYQWQRKIIESAFGCRVYSWYGHSEYLTLGGECEYSTDYHCYSEYGITEVINRNGTPATPGECGEIIATGFNNYAMPLIRYRTEDLATRSLKQDCQCGRHYLLIQKIEGRLQEMIVGKSGNLISMTAINMHSNVFDNVYQFQFFQTIPGELSLRIIRKNNFSGRDKENIHQELMKKLADHIELRIEYVDTIPTTPRGKAQFLIQTLPIDVRTI